MKFESERSDDKWGEPSLAEMVSKAIDILKKGKDGFFLLVEGEPTKREFELLLRIYSLSYLIAVLCLCEST
jgi:hypothetical protein